MATRNCQPIVVSLVLAYCPRWVPHGLLIFIEMVISAKPRSAYMRPWPDTGDDPLLITVRQGTDQHGAHIGIFEYQGNPVDDMLGRLSITENPRPIELADLLVLRGLEEALRTYLQPEFEGVENNQFFVSAMLDVFDLAESCLRANLYPSLGFGVEISRNEAGLQIRARLSSEGEINRGLIKLDPELTDGLFIDLPGFQTSTGVIARTYIKQGLHCLATDAVWRTHDCAAHFIGPISITAEEGSYSRLLGLSYLSGVLREKLPKRESPKQRANNVSAFLDARTAVLSSFLRDPSSPSNLPDALTEEILEAYGHFLYRTVGARNIMESPHSLYPTVKQVRGFAEMSRARLALLTGLDLQTNYSPSILSASQLRQKRPDHIID